METFTLVLLIVTILLAIAVIILAITKWKSWTESDRSALLSQMYALAKTVYDALKDGKLEAAEIKVLFNQVVGIIASIAGRHTDEVEEEFKDSNSTYTISASTNEQS